MDRRRKIGCCWTKAIDIADRVPDNLLNLDKQFAISKCRSDRIDSVTTAKDSQFEQVPCPSMADYK